MRDDEDRVIILKRVPIDNDDNIFEPAKEVFEEEEERIRRRERSGF